MPAETDSPVKLISSPSIAAYRYRDPTTVATRALGSTGSTDVINVTETGKLLAILVYVTGVPAGSPTMRLEIVVDGGTQENIPLYEAANNWGDFFVRLTRATTNLTNSNGSQADHNFYLLMDCPYQTSLIVRANCTGAGSAGSVAVYGIRATQQ